MAKMSNKVLKPSAEVGFFVVIFTLTAIDNTSRVTGNGISHYFWKKIMRNCNRLNLLCLLESSLTDK